MQIDKDPMIETGTVRPILKQVTDLPVHITGSRDVKNQKGPSCSWLILSPTSLGWDGGWGKVRLSRHHGHNRQLLKMFLSSESIPH